MLYIDCVFHIRYIFYTYTLYIGYIQAAYTYMCVHIYINTHTYTGDIYGANRVYIQYEIYIGCMLYAQQTSCIYVYIGHTVYKCVHSGHVLRSRMYTQIMI